MDQMLNDREKQIQLYEKYSNLLSSSQKQILNMVLIEDYSYTEIAQILDISKAAVSDAVKKGLNNLNKYNSAINNDAKIKNDSLKEVNLMYKRVLLKLSGEALANKSKNLSIDNVLVSKIANEIKQLVSKNIQVSIVIGGGNFWRGASAEKNGIPRNRADYIGMLATVMNALALQSGFEQQGLKARVQSSLDIDARVAEKYINEKTVKYLNNNEVVIFAGGTGRPYFTTDTAATLFASEIKADAILMGKNNVDGIYDSDPKTNPDAKRYDTISYDEVLKQKLKVMDTTAITMARDNNMDLIVFNLLDENAISRVFEQDIKFTRVIKEGK